MANAEKLLALKEWARGEWDKMEAGEPSEWRQAFWYTRTDCGTACCLAGKQMILEGYEPYFYTGFERLSSYVRHPETGEMVDVSMGAQRALELTLEEASALFFGGNDMKDVERIIDGLVNGTFDPEEEEEGEN